MSKQLSVYVSKEQYEWLKNQPRSFNLSKQIRELFDTWMGTKYEVESDDKTNTESDNI